MKKIQDGNYTVGYGKPPRETRFRKGRSGNPGGRPRGSRNLATLMGEALAERVVINENGRRKKAVKIEVIVKQLVNKATQGDHRSIQLLMVLAERHQPTYEARERSSRDPEQAQKTVDLFREAYWILHEAGVPMPVDDREEAPRPITTENPEPEVTGT